MEDPAVPAEPPWECPLPPWIPEAGREDLGGRGIGAPEVTGGEGSIEVE